VYGIVGHANPHDMDASSLCVVHLLL
jgi:hypothetical protein